MKSNFDTFDKFEQAEIQEEKLAALSGKFSVADDIWSIMHGDSDSSFEYGEEEVFK